MNELIGLNSKRIYCFGNAANGEFGLGGIEDVNILLPRKLKSDKLTMANCMIKELSCGRNHTLALLYKKRLIGKRINSFSEDSDDGILTSGDFDLRLVSILMTCGSNERCQLGRESGSWLRFENVAGLDAHFVIQVASGANHNLVLTEAGQIFAWGCNLFGQTGLGFEKDADAVATPRLIKKLAAEQTIRIACGAFHSLALTKGGRVYAWGSNSFGQLGLGTNGNCEYNPVEVTNLNSVPIRIIAGGGCHTLALSEIGAVYGWGKNDSGQLGIGHTDSRNEPTLLKSLRNQQVKYVDCGEDHSGALTKDGRLWMWGCGNYGQLGHSKFSNELMPLCVVDLMGLEVTQISLGRCHSLAAIGSTGRVYSFGLNGSGQLGLGSKVNRNSPYRISSRWVDIEAKEIVLQRLGGPMVPVKLQSVNLPNRQQLISENERETQSDEEAMEVEDDGDDGEVSSPVVSEPEDSPDSPEKKKASVQIDEYESDPDSDTEIKKRSQLILSEVLSSRGDQSFVLVTKLSENIRPKDFRIDDWKSNAVSIDNKQIDELKNVKIDQQIPMECVDYIENAFGSTCSWNRSYVCRDLNLVDTNLPLVDFDSALHGFHSIEELENQRIVSLIYDLIVKQAIPSLPVELKSHQDAEILRIYVLLPLFHMFHFGSKNRDIVNNLICNYANRVLSSSSEVKRVLCLWWSVVDVRFYKELLTIYKRVVVELLLAQQKLNRNERDSGTQNYYHHFSMHGEGQRKVDANLHNNLKTSLDFLSFLHTINQENNRLSRKEFYIPEIIDLVDIKLDYVYWLGSRARGNQNFLGRTTELFFYDYPFIFDSKAKTLVLAADTSVQQKNAAENAIYRSLVMVGPLMFVSEEPHLVISVSRNNIVQDTINQLIYNQKSLNFKKPLRIDFKGEEAIDEGIGMKKEFFLLLMKEILDPKYGMFNVFHDSNFVWFNPMEAEELVMYELIGIICGLAIYNQIIIYLPFPLSLYKKILGEPLGLDDITVIDQVLGKNLNEMISTEYGIDEFDAIFGDMTFQIAINCFGAPVEFELVPNGKDKTVTYANRKEYVDSYWDFFLNKSVAKQYDSFRTGFAKVVDVDILKMFNAEELMEMVTGQEAYDWMELEKHGTYYKLPFNATHPTIVTFWKIFHGLTQEQKKRFLLFLSGSDRIPILGMKFLRLIIQPMKVNDDHLPVAHTCFNILDLPEEYTSEDKLKAKLLQTIEYTQGFGLA